MATFGDDFSEANEKMKPDVKRSCILLYVEY